MSVEKDFFYGLGFGYEEIGGVNYAKLESVGWNELGIITTLEVYNTQSEQLAKLVEEYSNKIIIESKNNKDLLNNLGYPKFKITPELVSYSDPLTMMRLSYVISRDGQPQLIEVNAQTPSFWWECETGTQKVLEKLNPQAKRNDTVELLKQALKTSSEYIRKELGKNFISVGIVVGDSKEDIFTMQWIANLLTEVDEGARVEVLTLSQLDFLNEKQAWYSINSGAEFDGLMLWYPLELLVDMEFENGVSVWDVFTKSISNKKLILLNGLTAFVAQNKYLLAYMTEFWNDIESRGLAEVLAPSYYTLEEFEKYEGKDTPWIAKPIWGREGNGVFGYEGSKKFSGNMSDEYFTNQWYVYQPFYEGTKLAREGKQYSYTLEQWVYKDTTGIWKCGGKSLRLASGSIVDNNSRWLVIE
jgi:glutathionylspermidine synthase